jgi:transcriptional regulator with XRE-family HTH domain
MKIRMRCRSSPPAPPTFDQEVTVKKPRIVGRLRERIKALGLNRIRLAAKMGFSSARVTAMMDGTSRLPIETLVRAAAAADGPQASGTFKLGHVRGFAVSLDSGVA